MRLLLDEDSAEWLVQKKQTIPVLLAALGWFISQSSVKSGKVSVGSVRILFDLQTETIGFQNLDFLTRGIPERFGIVQVSGGMGVLDTPGIAAEVFERALTVVKARLRNYFIDGSYIHRAYENGAHTCVSGRGSVARQQNIGFMEYTNPMSEEIEAVLVTGPAHDFQKLVKELLILKKGVGAFLDNGVKLRGKATDLADLSKLEQFVELTNSLLAVQGLEIDREASDYEVQTESNPDRNIHTYDQYVGGLLIGVQKKIFDSDVIYSSPLRILGPAGSGKTLLMQLLSIKLVKDSSAKEEPLRCLYLVHSNEMIQKVKERFLSIEPTLSSSPDQTIEVNTLYSFAIHNLGITYESVVDSDAYDAKVFQLEEVRESIQNVARKKGQNTDRLGFLRGLVSGEDGSDTVSALIMNEISCTIKGQGLLEDREKYVFSERPLSSLHGVLNQYDREFLFDAFDDYHNRMFNEYSVLDTDDIAISLLARLRTPLWGMQRKVQGFDYIFIDEAQLFNENERKIFSLLPNKKRNGFLPVVIALDAAQDLYNQFTFSLSSIGIDDIANENLESVHRSTKEITALAFFVIQKSTSLFTPEFPDFTRYSKGARPLNSKLDLPPIACRSEGDTNGFTKFVLKKLVSLQKKAGFGSIAIVCFSDVYWNELTGFIEKNHVNVEILESRGGRLSETAVILSRPQYVGGQEFDCVIIVGLEQGVYPPNHFNSPQLQATVDEQCIREMYLSISRARHRVIFALNSAATPNLILKEAIDSGKVSNGRI